MKLNLSGVAFGALMVGLVASGAAKADVAAYADLNITSAFLSGDVSSIGNVFIDNSYGASTTFGPIGGATTVNNPGVGQGGTVTASQGTGSNVAANTGTNGATSNATLTGSLLSITGVASDVNSSITLQNGYTALQQTTGASSGTDSSFKFTALSTGTVTLHLNGTYITYAAQSNSNSTGQNAHANIDFKIGVSNTTEAQGDQGGDLLSSNKSVVGTVPVNGSLTPVTFTDLTTTFTLLAGDTYELTITQAAGVYGVAVPEPGTLALFGAGLAGLGFLGFRRQKKSGGLAA